MVERWRKHTAATLAGAALVVAGAGGGYLIAKGGESNERPAASSSSADADNDHQGTERGNRHRNRFDIPTLSLTEGQVMRMFKAEGALNYPDLVDPDPSRAPKFPDVAQNGHSPLVAYEGPFEDGDYFEDGHGDIDLPQFYYRVMTAGEIVIPQLDINCKSTDEKGCAVILINHFGETAMFRNTVIDNGFTISGRVFDMSAPGQVTEAAQALLDHYMGRMTASVDGANCGDIDACQDVEWHVAVVGNGRLQEHWAGLYGRR